jgi:hypothetical protein
MSDRGFFLTWQAISRQLAAMPAELYLVRLIHSQSRRAFPGERVWNATQLAAANTIRFLRARNHEGCDIYIHPYAENQNAGYILVDLDDAQPTVLETMRADGYEPCVIVQTSPGHLQAWICLGTAPLEPAVATAASKLLARVYDGDPASTGWRHLGRLAGFTNQKPERRSLAGLAPWVRIVYARAGRARRADALLQAARAVARRQTPAARRGAARCSPAPDNLVPSAPSASSRAAGIYRDCMQRWHITQRFAQPDWSIVDLWIARYLLSHGTPSPQVETIVRLGSPQFPRRHSDPDDYLRRTLARAAFPAPRGRAVCDTATAGDYLPPAPRHPAGPPGVGENSTPPATMPLRPSVTARIPPASDNREPSAGEPCCRPDR